jgi:UDP-N-acetylglucosamine 4,6-dehydratase/5-epimerase
MQEKLKKYFKGKTIIIFGGTGSWGSELVRQIVEMYDPKEIRVFSRGEHKQVEMRQKYRNVKNIRYIIGDVRDAGRVDIAMKGVDVAFNLAALKHVPVCEENVFEAIQTNAIGCHNVIKAAMRHDIDTFVQVSTDKAVDPLNLYGFTKGCAEKLSTSANNSVYKSKKTKFVCVRGGNVLSTAGSVVPLFIHQIRCHNKITLTDDKMSRYIMRVEEAINLVLKSMIEASGGEIFVMKMPGIKIIDLAHVMIKQLGDKNTKIEKIGIRPGEKLYEVLISKNEAPRTVGDGDYYVILPDAYHENFDRKKYAKYKPIGMEEYNSYNTHQLNQKQILELLEKDGWLNNK